MSGAAVPLPGRFGILLSIALIVGFGDARSQNSIPIDNDQRSKIWLHLQGLLVRS